MNQLCGKYVNVVLAVEMGEGFEFAAKPLKIVANLNGKQLESDLVDPSSIPIFKTELVWETEKRELRRLRSGSAPLRVEVQTPDKNHRRARIGFALLSTRCASVIQDDSKMPIEFKWQKLLGVSSEYKVHHPALYLSLTIRNATSQELADNTSSVLDVAIEEQGEAVEELDEDEKNSKYPIQYIQDGFVQIGENDCDETYLLNITVQVAYNLDLLLPEMLVFHQSREKYFISFKVFGIVVKSKPFCRDLHANIQMNEKIGVRIRSDFNTLKTYFNDLCKVMISFYCGCDKLGTTQLFLTDLLTNLSESEFLVKRGIASGEQKCLFTFPHLNGIVPIGTDERQPFIEVGFVLKRVDASSELDSFTLSIPSCDSLKSLDSTMEFSVGSPRSIIGEEYEEDVERAKGEHDSEEEKSVGHINVDRGDGVEESSDEEEVLTYRCMDEAGDGLHGRLKKVEEEIVEKRLLEERQVEERRVEEQRVEERRVEERRVKEQRVEERRVEERRVEERRVEERRAEERRVEEQGVEEPGVDEQQAEYVVIEENQEEEEQIEREEEEQIEREEEEELNFEDGNLNGQIQSEPNLILKTEYDNDGDTCKSTSNLLLKPIMIPYIMEEIPNLSLIYQQYCLDIVVETLTLKKQLKSKSIFLKFKHPKASTFVMTPAEIDNHVGEETVLENVRSKLFFISSTEQIRKMVYAWPAKLVLLSENQTVLTEELDIYTAMFLAKDRNECSYITECKSVRTYEPLGKLSIIMYLQEYGLAALPQSTQCDLLPPLLDEDISIKELRELQEWKKIQKAHFLADLKITENKTLLQLQTSWAKKKKELETKLLKSVTRCQTLSQELQTAVNNIRTKNALQQKESQMSVQRPFDENVRENIQKYCDFKNRELIETISKLERENQQLNDVIDDLRQDMHKIEKTALTKEQTTNLLQQLKGLEEKFEDAQQAKIYFKGQWQKAVKEIHDLRYDEQKEMQEKIFHQKSQLSELSLDSFGDSEIGVKTNFDQRAYGMHSSSNLFKEYNLDFMPQSASTLFKKI